LIGAVVHRVDEVDSTQSALARLAQAGAPEGAVLTARHQTAGRGRRGRPWWDAPGESLLLSVLLRPTVSPAQAPQLSLVAALAVADALAAAASVAARIRWPNDVLVEGRKICGILPEATCRGDGGLDRVILGVGLNVDQPEFPPELAARATSLRLVTGRRHESERVLSALLDALDHRYADWRAGGFAEVREAWRGRSATLGSSVRLPDGRLGIAVDVAPDGALVVDAGDGRLARLVSGEPAAAH